MKPFIIAACTLMLIGFGNSYSVQRDSMSSDMTVESFLQQIFERSVDAYSMNICPGSKFTLLPFEWGM